MTPYGKPSLDGHPEEDGGGDPEATVPQGPQPQDLLS